MAEQQAPKGNALTRKIGPLPMWAWVAIIGAVILLWAWHARKKAGTQQPPASSANVTPPVVEQFQLTTPPEQDDTDDTDVDHPKKHKPRKHPTHGVASGQGKGGGGDTGPPIRKPVARRAG